MAHGELSSSLPKIALSFSSSRDAQVITIFSFSSALQSCGLFSCGVFLCPVAVQVAVFCRVLSIYLRLSALYPRHQKCLCLTHWTWHILLFLLYYFIFNPSPNSPEKSLLVFISEHKKTLNQYWSRVLLLVEAAGRLVPLLSKQSGLYLHPKAQILTGKYSQLQTDT